MTALVVWRLEGGELLKTDANGQLHFYNRIEGLLVDFTAGQFDIAPKYLDLPASADEVFADTSRQQYETLLQSVTDAIASLARRDG